MTDLAGSAAIEQIASLLDWRRQVALLYQDIRSAASPEQAFTVFTTRRDRLFAEHPQSPLEAPSRRTFRGLSYHRYEPALRFLVDVDAAVEPERFEVALRDDGSFRMRRLGTVGFHHHGRHQRLSLFWIEGYGGGLFLPFRDATNGSTTYGGGRYLLDTLKHADLGWQEGKLMLDFNFAYHPSCAYSPAWDCPLAPPENRLEVAIEAGERLG